MSLFPFQSPHKTYAAHRQSSRWYCCVSSSHPHTKSYRRLVTFIVRVSGGTRSTELFSVHTQPSPHNPLSSHLLLPSRGFQGLRKPAQPDDDTVQAGDWDRRLNDVSTLSCFATFPSTGVLACKLLFLGDRGRKGPRVENGPWRGAGLSLCLGSSHWIFICSKVI